MVARSELRTVGDELGAMTPCTKLVAVTPDNANDLPGGPCKALYIGTAGNIEVIAEGDADAVVLVAATGWQPIRVKRVLATSTTADDIVAGYGPRDPNGDN